MYKCTRSSRMRHLIMALPETIGDGIGRRSNAGVYNCSYVRCKSSPNRIELVVE